MKGNAFGYWNDTTFQRNQNEHDMKEIMEYCSKCIPSHWLAVTDERFDKYDMRAFDIKYNIKRNERYVTSFHHVLRKISVRCMLEM